VADDAGALLVRSGLVSTSSLDDARARVTTIGGTIGEQLVAADAISDDALTDFYRSRLLVPQVNPNTLARLPVRVVAAIPSDMAIELRAIPVALDAENNLTVAMSDPSDRHAVDEIAFFTGAYVVRAVATQMQIAWCLAHYYGHVTALGQRLLSGTVETPVQPRSPEPASSGPLPRAKGLTGKVDALRHRAMAPVTGPVNLPRRQSGEIAAVAPPPEEPVRAVSQPEISSDGVPDQPRARSISGEIRLPARRAPSIRPPIPEIDDDESGPVITVEVTMTVDDEPTGPRKPAPPRRRAVKSDPPELYARAGEVDIASARERLVDEGPGIIIADELLETPPQEDRTGEFLAAKERTQKDTDSAAPVHSIEVSDEASEGVVIHERVDRESEPVMLIDRRPPSDPPEDDEVVELQAKKPRVPRPERRTQVGIGALPAVTRSHRDTEANPDLDDPTGVDTRPAIPDLEENTIDPIVEPPKPSPPRAHTPTVDDLDDDDRTSHDEDEDEDGGNTTAVMSVVELDEAIPRRSADVVPGHLAGASDDGWGPPGTTIPPPLLGAIPGSVDDEVPGRIPMSSVDRAPLIVAAPSPPEITQPTKTPQRPQEDSATLLLKLIRDLEHARDRDTVVGMMVAHLADTHRRAGFFVVKPGATKGTTELSVFSVEPRPASLPFATLRLDRPSTLQDVVGTRLPYRGPTMDEASRIFLAGALGVAPPEILLVPVAVRERVVGVLFAETRLRHTFDDQLALAARAAGMALERILMAKRN
jgi:hypothetical protein